MFLIESLSLARRKRNESRCCMFITVGPMNKCVVVLACRWLKCAVVSRWACRKRRRRNSPCIRREDVLMMAGMKVLLRL